MAAAESPPRPQLRKHTSRRTMASPLPDETQSQLDSLGDAASVLRLDSHVGTVTCSLRLLRKGSERFCFWTNKNYFVLVDLSKLSEGAKPVRLMASKTPSTVVRAVYLASVGLICCVCVPTDQDNGVRLPTSFAFLSPLTFKLQALHFLPSSQEDPRLYDTPLDTPACILDSSTFAPPTPSRRATSSRGETPYTPRGAARPDGLPVSQSEPQVVLQQRYSATFVTADSNGVIAEWRFDMTKTPKDKAKVKVSPAHGKRKQTTLSTLRVTSLGESLSSVTSFRAAAGKPSASTLLVFGSPSGSLYTVRHPSLDLMKKTASGHSTLRDMTTFEPASMLFTAGDDFLRAWLVSSAETKCQQLAEHRQPSEPCQVVVSGAVVYVATQLGDVVAFAMSNDGAASWQLSLPQRFFRTPLDASFRLDFLLAGQHGYVAVANAPASSNLLLNFGALATGVDLSQPIVPDRPSRQQHQQQDDDSADTTSSSESDASLGAKSSPSPSPSSSLATPPDSPIVIRTGASSSSSSSSVTNGSPKTSMWRSIVGSPSGKRSGDSSGRLVSVSLDGSAARGILRQSRADGGEELPASPSRLRWSPDINVMLFPYAQGGSTSVPSDGSYSIGLDWVPKDVRQMNLDVFDRNGLEPSPKTKKRMPCYRHPDERLAPLSQKQRKKLLKHAGAKLQKKELVELTEIRRGRAQAFCFCSSKRQPCKTERCPCFALGVACQIEAQRCCLCTAEHCANPEGNRVFNVRAVSNIRAETLRSLSSPSLSSSAP